MRPATPNSWIRLSNDSSAARVTPSKRWPTLHIVTYRYIFECCPRYPVEALAFRSAGEELESPKAETAAELASPIPAPLEVPHKVQEEEVTLDRMLLLQKSCTLAGKSRGANDKVSDDAAQRAREYAVVRATVGVPGSGSCWRKERSRYIPLNTVTYRYIPLHTVTHRKECNGM